jgi:predicted anti-sigma-YlaC factor YlaD
MSCQHYEDWLGDAIDGTLEPHKQTELDAHCQACAACRDLLDDLRKIRAAAAALDRRTPSPELWNAIAAKVEASRRGQLTSSWVHLAAAAALVAALGVAAWWGLTLRPQSTDPQTTSTLVRTAASELQLAEQHYLNAIASLEQLTLKKDTTLDPAVAAEIAQSLKTIDRAIDDSRAALKSDPSSFVAQTSLLEALRMKVALLQETVSLMNAS